MFQKMEKKTRRYLNSSTHIPDKKFSLSTKTGITTKKNLHQQKTLKYSKGPEDHLYHTLSALVTEVLKNDSSHEVSNRKYFYSKKDRY